MSTLGYTDLVDRLAVAAELPRERVARVLDALADLVPAQIAAGCSVRLHPRLGILRAVRRASRAGIGPNGQRWARPARLSVRLAVSGVLQQQLHSAGGAG